MKERIGAVVWLLLFAAGALAVRRIPVEARDRFERTNTELWRSLFAPSPEFHVVFAGGVELARGDGVYRLDPHGLVRMGEVVETRWVGRDLVATLLVDTGRGGPALTQGTRVVHRTKRQSFLACLQVLLPAERRAQIDRRWQQFRQLHEQRILALLRPLLPGLMQASMEFLEAEFRRALERHRPQLEGWLERRRGELTEAQLVPLLREVVWPIVREVGRPTAETIGRELWERAPLFDLAWRAAYDALLEERPVKLEARWRAFVQEEAVPVLEDSQPLLLATLEEILREVAGDEEVRRRARALSLSLLTDPELLAILRRVLEDVFVDNAALGAFLQGHLEDARVRERLLAVHEELQVFFDEVGNLLFFDASGEGIQPDLAQLLRTLLLRRDVHFLFLEIQPGAPLARGETLVGVRER